MVHPFIEYDEDREINDMRQITVTLEMCTLYKGVPHGIALIDYQLEMPSEYCFRGLGIFHHGKLHNSPFSCFKLDGYPEFYSKMENGRPADASYHTQFFKDREGLILYSQYETRVGGW